jgi:hypothetical protein
MWDDVETCDGDADELSLWEQLVADVAEMVAGVPPGARVFWSCEYVCPVDVSGEMFVVEPFRDADCSTVLTFGVGERSCELWVPVDDASDGWSVWAQDWWPGRSDDWSDTFASLLWVGRRSDPGFVAAVDDVFGMRLGWAWSRSSIEGMLAQLVSLTRPDVLVCFDANWMSHDNPLLVHLSDRLDDVRHAASVEAGPPTDLDSNLDLDGLDAEDGGGCDGVLLAEWLEELDELYLAGLSAEVRERVLYERRWMSWSDGTFDPDGFRS